LEAERAKLAEERKAIEDAERSELVGKLVELGAEIPTTAWATDATGLPKAGTPAPELAGMPIEALRARVAKFSASPPRPSSIAPPTSTSAAQGGKTFVVDGRVVQLSASELSVCEEMGAKPDVYAANKLARL